MTILLSLKENSTNCNYNHVCICTAEAEGTDSNYVSAFAVLSVNNTDYETINKLSKSPIICYDNDGNGAGYSLVEKAKKYMSVSAFTTSGQDSDLDSFIQSFGYNSKAAWEAIKNLARLIHKTFDRVVRHPGITISNGTKLGFHDLKHVFATWLHREGVSLDEIRFLLGHKDRATTDRYTSVDRLETGKALMVIPNLRKTGQKKNLNIIKTKAL